MNRILQWVLSLALLSGGAYAAVDVGVGVDVRGHHNDFNLSFFYESMAPYGEWREVRDYGWVWQPEAEVTVADWRPYANEGHWVWTDEGWFWASDYDWGWAPFHYGRWAYTDDLKWVWIPDTTWGPAWVTWRDSDRFYGWAPLPPDVAFESGVGFSFHNRHVDVNFDFGLGANFFTFVPADRFLDANIAVVAVPAAQNVNVFRETKIVNNTYVFNDNRVINNGIPVQRVATATKRDVKPVQVAASNQPQAAKLSGDKIAAFKPQIKREAPQPPSAFASKTGARGQANQSAQKNAETRAGTAANPQTRTATQPNAAGTNATQPERSTTETRGNRADERSKAEPAHRPENSRPIDTSTERNKPENARPETRGTNPEAAKPEERSDLRSKEREPVNTSVDRSRAPEAPRAPRAQERSNFEEAHTRNEARKAETPSTREEVREPQTREPAPASREHEASRPTPPQHEPPARAAEQPERSRGDEGARHEKRDADGR